MFATYLKLTLTMFFWGGAWVAGRVIVQEVHPLEVAFYRFFIAAIGLGLFIVASEGRLQVPPTKELLSVTLLGLTGIFAYNVFFFYGLQHVAAGRGALVVALNPVAIALIAWLFFGERMIPPRALGVTLGLAGCLLVITAGNLAGLVQGDIGLGEWLMLGCVASWTAYTFVARRATMTLTPLTANFYACVVGCFLLGLTANWQGLPTSPPHYSLTVWTCLLFLGLFATTLGFTWYIDGVKHAGPTKAAAFINLMPVAAVVQGAWLLDERLDAVVLTGGALVVIGVYLTNHGSVLHGALVGHKNVASPSLPQRRCDRTQGLTRKKQT